MNESVYTNQVRGLSAADAMPEERASFIRKTYLHLAGTVVLFAGLIYVTFATGQARVLTSTMLGTSYSWLIVLGIFMGVSWLAESWGRSATSIYMQYMGLFLLALAYSIIFVPLLYVAAYYGGGVPVIFQAGVITGGLFAGLSSVVFITRKDFSFLGPIVAIGGFVALGFIVSGILFGFGLGSLFAFGMVALAGASILYQTSNTLHHYRTDQHVAAAMGLFASIAILFWYILQIFMSRD